MNHLNKNYLKARKDPVDLRDFYYEGSLLELPQSIDNRRKIPHQIEMDQETEGACTGFGLAAVVNYLLHNRKDSVLPQKGVSPRMLYEMAKRYDEWEGEDDEESEDYDEWEDEDDEESDDYDDWEDEELGDEDDYDEIEDWPDSQFPQRPKFAILRCFPLSRS